MGNSNVGNSTTIYCPGCGQSLDISSIPEVKYHVCFCPTCKGVLRLGALRKDKYIDIRFFRPTKVR